MYYTKIDIPGSLRIVIHAIIRYHRAPAQVRRGKRRGEGDNGGHARARARRRGGPEERG